MMQFFNPANRWSTLVALVLAAVVSAPNGHAKSLSGRELVAGRTHDAPPTSAGPIEVRVVPDREDWTYSVGEKIRFRVTATRDGHPLARSIRYTIGPEQMAVEEKSADMALDGLVIESEPVVAPGFIRCSVILAEGGQHYRGLATAAVDPESITPTQIEPEDFDAFWAAGKAELAKTPMDARLTLMPGECTSEMNVYHVSIRTVGTPSRTRTGPDGARVYGILCEPKEGGTAPAVLRVPGAGVYPFGGERALAAKGMLTLEIGIHGIPVNLPAEVYSQLRFGALAGYPGFNLDDPQRYYYRRVHLSCLRALEFLASREKFDGQNLFVIGGSQGGQLAIATAALDSRVRAFAACYPAYCDVTGYLHGRAGGWPHLLRPDPVTGAPSLDATASKLNTMSYYDTVNFARRLRIPGILTWGYNDETCPPTSLYAAYNVITSPKILVLARNTGHSITAEQQSILHDWLQRQVIRQ